MSRILMTASKLDGYGAPRMMMQYALALRAAAHEVLVMHGDESLRRPNEKLKRAELSGPVDHQIAGEIEIPQTLARAGVKMEYCPGLQWSGMLPGGGPLRKLSAVWKPDLIIGTQIRDSASAMATARKLQVPGVVLAQNQPQFGGNPLSRMVKNRVYRRTMKQDASRIICVGPGVRDTLVQQLRIPPDRVRVIVNGVDLEGFPGCDPAVRTSIRTELGLRDEEFVFVCLARMHQQKGQDVLIEAFRILMTPEFDQPNVPVRLLLVGDARAATEIAFDRKLNQQIEKSGVRELIVKTGFRSDAVQVLYAADAFVMPSRWEGFFPLAAQESLAAARPSIITRCFGDFAGPADGTEVFYVPVEDPQALAARMKTLMEFSYDERMQMGRRGRTWLRNNLSLAEGQRRFVTEIEDLLKTHQPAQTESGS